MGKGGRCWPSVGDFLIMTTKTFSLNYDGYWLESSKGGVPNGSGVYTVYAATHNASANTVSIRQILYIGESATVRDRLRNHEKTSAWKQHLRRGEVLCFNYAPVAASSRVRVEAALIHHHRPPTNTEYVNTFPFPTTTVSTSGRNEFLRGYFTVQGTRVASWY